MSLKVPVDGNLPRKKYTGGMQPAELTLATYFRILKDNTYIQTVLSRGRDRAQPVAAATLKRAQENMGLRDLTPSS